MRYFFLLIFLFGVQQILAQGVKSYADSGGKSKKSASFTKYVQKEGEEKRTRRYRESSVDARNAKIEKKKRKLPKGIMGECPGNPKSKLNRRNPYKRSRS